MSRCILEVGGEPVVVSVGGRLDAEYALFDPGDIELSATGPGTIRETGYRTTVREARARLTQAGLTDELAAQATAATRRSVARAFARGAAVRCVADRLEAAELFEGHVFDPTTGRYAGAWLDLPALVAALSTRLDPARGAESTGVLQALHLAARLAEYPDDALVVLTTAELSSQRRPGERTFKRLSFRDPSAVVAALHGLKGGRDAAQPDSGPGRHEIVRWFRERAPHTPAAAARCAEIEAALGARSPPDRGPLADAELWAIETKLAMGETEGVLEQLDGIERRRGRLPGTAYLRDRVALMTGNEEPRTIAERASALSTSMGAFYELQLLAAQAWAKAGDVRRAHAFARDLSESAAASDALRMQAREVLDDTGRAATAPEGAVPVIPRPPLAPSGTDLGTVDTGPPSAHAVTEGAPRRGGSRGQYFRSGPADLSLPFFRMEPAAASVDASLAPIEAEPRQLESEAIENLSLPPGLRDQPPPSDERPRTPNAGRVACTYLARELGRELRLRHGVELRTDVGGLELAQRYLFEAIAGDQASSADEEREITRHGAFLSELLARRLGARWVDFEPPDAARWAMVIRGQALSGEASRVWPFGRVLRFVARRHRERDLVSYYLELEALTR